MGTSDEVFVRKLRSFASRTHLELHIDAAMRGENAEEDYIDVYASSRARRVARHAKAASTATRGVRSRYLVAREASERGMAEKFLRLKKKVRVTVAHARGAARRGRHLTTTAAAPPPPRAAAAPRHAPTLPVQPAPGLLGHDGPAGRHAAEGAPRRRHVHPDARAGAVDGHVFEVPSLLFSFTITPQLPRHFYLYIVAFWGGSTAGVIAIVHFGSVGRLWGLFERSKAT